MSIKEKYDIYDIITIQYLILSSSYHSVIIFIVLISIYNQGIIMYHLISPSITTQF